MPYQVEIKPSAKKTLEKLPRDVRVRITAAIDILAINPRPPKSKKLVNRTEYRIRIGDYRILYEINDNKLFIMVIKIGHRNNAYDD